MKRLLGIAILCILVVTGCSSVRSTVRSEADAAVAAGIERMIDQRLYKVNFTRAYPASAPSFNLRDVYYISVIGDRVESYLPYFGRAWSIPYGGGEGLHFEAPITGYTDQVGRKGQRTITFSARTREDIYDFTLVVWPLGGSNLIVRPHNRQSISFGGEVDPSPEFEAARVGE